MVILALNRAPPPPPPCGPAGFAGYGHLAKGLSPALWARWWVPIRVERPTPPPKWGIPLGGGGRSPTGTIYTYILLFLRDFVLHPGMT